MHSKGPQRRPEGYGKYMETKNGHNAHIQKEIMLYLIAQLSCWENSRVAGRILHSEV